MTAFGMRQYALELDAGERRHFATTGPWWAHQLGRVAAGQSPVHGVAQCPMEHGVHPLHAS